MSEHTLKQFDTELEEIRSKCCKWRPRRGADHRALEALTTGNLTLASR